MSTIGGGRGSRRAEDHIHFQDRDQLSEQQQQDDNFTDHHPHRGNDFAPNSVTAFSEDPSGRAGQGSVDEAPTTSACDSPQVPGSGARPNQRLPTQYQPQPLPVEPPSAEPQSSRTLHHPWHYRHDVITTSSQGTVPTGGRPQPVLVGPPSSARPQSHTTFHHPGLCPQNVITTSSQALEMTSWRNSPVVIQPSVGATWIGLVDTSSPPTEGVIIVTAIAAFVSIFCCLCTGLPAFVVAIQAKSKKSAGQYQEARQKLWCSFALIVASLFIVIPTILLYCLPYLSPIRLHHDV